MTDPQTSAPVTHTRPPGMIQKSIRDLIEDHARERGYSKIDKTFVAEAREQFEPK